VEPVAAAGADKAPAQDEPTGKHPLSPLPVGLNPAAAPGGSTMPSNRKTGLDYWNAKQVVNFRDIGEFVNLIAGADLLPVGRLFRGGTLRHVESLDAVGSPRTIFNLQKGSDPEFAGVVNHHFPISNDYEKYETTTPEVRAWLRRIVAVVEQGVALPLYIHCLSGKDRTGVVTATLLSLLGIPRECIIQEYLLSEGKVDQQFIETALDGITPLARTFHRVDLPRVRSELLGTPRQAEPPASRPPA